MTETIDNASAAASTLFLGQNGEWWDFWLIVSLIFAAGAAIAIGVTTAGSIVSHKREALASEKALGKYQLETEGKIAEANARAADANARAAEATLALEKFKAPRLIEPAMEARIRSKIRPFPATPFDLSVIPGDPEALNFAIQIATVLEAEKWSWIEFNHPSGPFMQVFEVPNKPNIGTIGSWAVIVQIHSEQADRLSPAAKALAAALDGEGFIAAAAGKPPAGVPNTDTIHIIVGKKIDPGVK